MSVKDSELSVIEKVNKFKDISQIHELFPEPASKNVGGNEDLAYPIEPHGTFNKGSFMRIKIISGLISILATIAIVCSAGAMDYYVSVSDGRDKNPGTSPDFPWQSLQKVSASTFKPGDRILLKRGNVWRSEIKCSSSGTEFAKIIFSAYGKGPLPRINASMPLTGWHKLSKGRFSTTYKGVCCGLLEDEKPLRKASSLELSDGQWFYDGQRIYYRPSSGAPSTHRVERCSKGAAFWIYQKSNLILDGLDLYGANTAALLIRNAKNVEVRNCRMTNSPKGISISLLPDDKTPNKNIVISNNEITFNGDGIYLVSPNNGPYHVADRVTISQNTITDTNYDLVWGHFSKDGHAIGIQNTSNSTFSYNTIVHNYSGIALWTNAEARSDNNRFFGNYVTDNQKYGIAHGGEGENNSANNVYAFNIISKNGSLAGPDGGLRINRKNDPSNYFVNNTLYKNDINIYLYSLTDKTMIYNNISYYPKEYHIFIAEKLRSNFIGRNLYYPDGAFFRLVNKTYNFQQWKRETSKDTDSLTADPLFVDSMPDTVKGYTLRAGSPAIGAGKDIPAGLDLTDFSRTTPNTPPDLGALHYSLKHLASPYNLRILN